MDVQQRIARLEGLLARIQERRAEPRTTASGAAASDASLGAASNAAPSNGQGQNVAAEARPATLPPDAYDEVVDLADDDIVEIRDSVPPSGGRPASVVPESSSVAPVSSEVPQAREPDASQPPPPMRSAAWPSSVPPEPEQPEELLDVSPPVPPPAARRPDFGLDFDDEEDEEPPASSRRPIASNMDEALADAAAREVPLKTPPPESGPQEAVIIPKGSGMPAAHVEDDTPGAAEASHLAEGIPTSAQLGNTVTLDEGGPMDFEVEVPHEAAARESAPAPSEDFEMRLPERGAVGTYDSDLAPPPEARSELDAHRERALAEAEAQAAEPVVETAAAAEVAVDQNEVFERPAGRHGAVTSVTGAAPRFRPGSFLELLDASLKLGKD